MNDLNFDGLTDSQLRLFAVRCARRVQHLMTDPRSLAALNVAERHAKGEATDYELASAEDAARAAATASEDAARAAAFDAKAAAFDAADVAWAAADVARDAARDAAWAAEAAAWAAEVAAEAAQAAERKAQQKILDEIKQEQPR